MVRFMPRLWLANVDEVWSPRTSERDAHVFDKVSAMTARFLFCLQSGDALLLPSEVPADFLRFVSGVQGFRAGETQVFHPAIRSKPYYLVNSTLADASLMQQLKNLVTGGDWTVEPYIESARVLALADALGIPAARSGRERIMDGLSEFINSKLCFKNHLRKMQIPVVEGLKARSAEALKEAIMQLSASGFNHLMLRKALGGGGMSNLSGTPHELVLQIPAFYQGGAVLVEPFLDLSATLGSLVEINENGLVYRGVDAQLIENGGWVGFSYPCPADCLTKQIEEWTLQIADSFRQMGALGYVNVDWGVLAGEDGVSSLVALECNFRHNGLSHVLDLTRRFAGCLAQDCHIIIKDNIDVLPADLDLNGLLKRLRSLPALQSGLVESPGRSSGFLPILPPRKGRCAMLFFGPNPEQVQEVQQAVQEALANDTCCLQDSLVNKYNSANPFTSSSRPYSY
jgi:hypothetical protein